MTERLTWATASELSRLYSRKELSPVDVVNAALARVQPSLPSTAKLTAKEQARLAELLVGRSERGPER